jgi:hypothetical protein
MSPLTDHLSATSTPIERRFYARVAPQAPATISIATDIPSNSPSTLLNLSENGLLISVANPLDVNSVHRVSLDLSGIPKTINVYVRTVWTENVQGLAGIQLLDLAEDDRELLRRWSVLQFPHREGFASPLPPEDAEKSTPDAAGAVTLAASPALQPAAALATPPSEEPPQDLFAERPILDDETNAVTIIRSHVPAHSSTSPLYFWGAALAVMCLGTVWASTHNVLGDFRTPKPFRSSIASSARPHRSPIPDLRPATPQSISNPAGPAPESSSTVASPPSAVTRVAKPSIPGPASNSISTVPNRTSEANSQNRPAFSRPLPSTDAVPKQSSSSREKLPAASDSEIASNVPAGKSAIVGSTRLPALPPAPHSVFNPAPITNAVSPPSSPSSSRYSPSASAVATPPPTIPHNAIRTAPDLNAGQTELKPFIVELPVPGKDGLVDLPGERVIYSPSVTMHIQRSVWLRGGPRFWHRHKKVEVGQLSAHVNPQTPRAPRDGSITVQAMIDRRGRVTGIKPLYGSIAFVPAVSRALSEWRYQPTYVDNKPVETVAKIEINFRSSSARSYRP